MKITKLDLFIVLVVALYIFVSINAPKYLQSKGDDVKAAVMTYNSLVGRGFGVRTEITGITSDYELKKISGIILGTTANKIYVWDGTRTWLVFDKKDVEQLVKEPQIPYIHPSIITFYPTESNKLTPSKECKGNTFVRKLVYIKLDKTSNEIVCDYVIRKIWEKYGGGVSCKYGGEYLELDFKFVHNLDYDLVRVILADFDYDIEWERNIYEECLVLME